MTDSSVIQAVRHDPKEAGQQHPASGWTSQPTPALKDFVAFFDDSGSADPNDSSKVFALGAVILPFSLLEPISQSWWSLIGRFTQPSVSPPLVGLECKSATLNDYVYRLDKGRPLTEGQSTFREYGIDLPGARLLVTEVWRFLSNLPCEVRFLGAVVNKEHNWDQFCAEDIATWRNASDQLTKREVSALRHRLQNDIHSKAFRWLLQRAQYLMDEQGTDSRCLVVGDDTYMRNDYYASQLHMQAGLEPYTRGSSILNNVVFGSSLHNPLLQMADWVGYAVRAWAEGRPNASRRSRFCFPIFVATPMQWLGAA